MANTAASDRYDRSRDRSIESIGSIDSIIFRSFKIFGNSSWRRCGSNGPKIIKIRAILAIFWPFEDFCRKIRRPYRRRRKQWGGSGGGRGPPRSVRRRFDRFDNSFGSIDNCPAYLGGPLCGRAVYFKQVRLSDTIATNDLRTLRTLTIVSCL